MSTYLVKLNENMSPESKNLKQCESCWTKSKK